MNANWKSLESFVRGIAELKWSAPCKPEHIDGVDFDGVCRISPDELVLLEITAERDLQKVRNDINKIQPIRIRLATNGLICRGFVVLGDEPTNSMVELGRSSHITVCSAAEFARTFFDFHNYDVLRENLPFGSAIDARTGKNDPRTFVPVNYTSIDQREPYQVSTIARALQHGKHLVLTGDYGTGKSRCIREVYNFLKRNVQETAAYPVAINLRDHWSGASALEILAGHLGNIGLGSSVDNLIRLLNSGHLVLLLDGFDEIGAQVHDARIEDRRSLRRRAVQGVRDLIQRTKAGVLIAGRSHFFDSAKEMTESLGLSNSLKVIHLEVPEVFSEQEAKQYLDALGVQVSLPEWLPRKPLVFQMLFELNPDDVKALLEHRYGEFEFWGAFIAASCRRESKVVGESISPLTIQLILQRLAAKTRYSNDFNGRLSPSDIDAAYESIVGSVPDQSGRQLLSRMCTLGRIEPESPDRQFIDPNVVDVLRAEALLLDVTNMTEDSAYSRWIQPLSLLGIWHAARYIRLFELEQHCFSYLRKFGSSPNTQRLAEIISALTALGTDTLDFQGLQISGANFPLLNIRSRAVVNLFVRESEIGLLVLDDTLVKANDGLTIVDCIVSEVHGVANSVGLPAWIERTEVITFERVTNAARIKESPLAPSQKLFLAIVHKIFFQPGSGREEGALLKGGYGQRYSPKLADAIIRLLMRHGIVDRSKGDDGWIYRPVRRHMERMNKIRSELTLSDDPIWAEITELKD